MSIHTPAEKRARTGTESPVSVSPDILKRKGDNNRESLESGKNIGLSSAKNSFGPAAIGMLSASRFGHDLSEVKLHADKLSPILPACSAPLMVQRSPLDKGDPDSAPCQNCPEAAANQDAEVSEPAAESSEPVTEAEPTSEESQPVEEMAAPGVTPAAALIVEDSVEESGPGQMRRSEFLARLRAEVTQAAESALAGTGRNTEDCPYLEHWFGYYRDQDSEHIERAIRRYAPETAGVRNAADYIPRVARRVSVSVERWARTGEITGVPEGLAGMGMAGMGLLGGVGRLVSGIGRMFFKSRQGGARKADNPLEVQRELGDGQPLEGGVRTRMESAFSRDFSHVRAHTDGHAADLSNDFNARAFTVGEDVAFGAGEYKPGTMAGDALIAHELAHVVQQGGSNESVAPMETGGGNYNELEKDADSSAVSTILSIWQGRQGNRANVSKGSRSHLQSGLKLQRCGPSLPQLRAPSDVIHESETFERQAILDIGQRGLEQVEATTDPRRRLDIEQGENNIQTDLYRSLVWLRQIYQEELADAGTDILRRRQAQYRFEEQVRRLRESYRRRFELNVKYRINFTVGRFEISMERRGDTFSQRWQMRAWSVEELNSIDRILDRVPQRYLQNFSTRVREIRREPQGGVASWEESTGILRVFDRAFENLDQLSLIIIHEVGHSTYQGRTAGSFSNLPPADWMRLSDWQMFTRGDVMSALGLRNDEERNEVLARLDRNAGSTAQYERPIPIDTPRGRRWVVHDKYQGEAVFPPNRFFHFSDNHINEFVSGYAKSHPAEDLAESIAHYLVNPGDTRRNLDVGRSGVTDKWDYLQNHYPEGLIRRKAKANQAGDIYEQKADEVAAAVMQRGLSDVMPEKNYFIKEQNEGSK